MDFGRMYMVYGMLRHSRMGYRVQDDSEFENHMIVGVNASVLNVQGNWSLDSQKLISIVYDLNIS